MNEFKFYMQWKLPIGDYDQQLEAFGGIEGVGGVNMFEDKVSLAYIVQAKDAGFAIMVAIMETQTSVPGVELIGVDYDKE